VIGELTSLEKVEDPFFGVVLHNCISLERKVQVYHWTESKRSVSLPDTGGGRLRREEYVYTTVWGENVPSSRAFHIAEGHENPENSIRGERFVSPQSVINNMQVDFEIVKKLDHFETMKLNVGIIDLLDPSIRNNACLLGDDCIYIGRDPSNPWVGDLKVQFRKISSPIQVSAIAFNRGNTLVPINSEGVSDFCIIKAGVHVAKSLIEGEEGEQNKKLWLGRLGGWFVNFISIILIAGPWLLWTEFFPLLHLIVAAETFTKAILTSLKLSFIAIFLAQDLSTVLKIGAFFFLFSSGWLITFV